MDIFILTQEEDGFKSCGHFVVYIKGQWTISNSIAILGTRTCSPEGRMNVRELCQKWSLERTQIHGGLAEGTEMEVRRNMTERNGRMLLFLHRGIHEEDYISTNETLVTPFPPNVPGQKFGFHKRNALLIDWTDSFILIEGAKSSGAFKIAQKALKQGKPVYAVKSLSGGSSFDGNLFLIEKGAIPLKSAFVKALENLTSFQKQLIKSIYKKPVSMDELARAFGNKSIIKYELLNLEGKGVIRLSADGLWH